MSDSPARPDICGDNIDEADKLAVEAMPEGYGADERDAELHAEGDAS